MKKLLIGLVLLSLVACDENLLQQYRDAPTQFIVKNIVDREGMKNMTTYYIEVVDVNGLVCGSEGRNL